MEAEKEPVANEQPVAKGQLTLSDMLGALDKDVAAGVEKKLKKLAKKKKISVPLDKGKADQVKRKVAYEQVSNQVTKWEPIVKKHRESKQVQYPLDQEPNVLEPISETIGELKPRNSFEKEVKNVITGSESALHDNKEFSKAEERYLKAISVDEAEKRHRELQRMRVLLGSYAVKMRRQKAIKSKSFRRLLRQERVKDHMKRVESDKDQLVQEIERLQKLRAQERATLKHKNTGKWAKHAKFRTKYDEAARQAMFDQIGLAKKFSEKPAEESNSESEDDDESLAEVSDDSASEIDDTEAGTETQVLLEDSKNIESNQGTIKSSEVISDLLGEGSPDAEAQDEDELDDVKMDSEHDNVQRALMSEAFADDDVVDEFRKAKDQIADEEQPKDVDTFLPGWGDWTGPGTKVVSKRRRKKYITKAKKVQRKDANLGNVIISEKANIKMKDFMVSKLPRGFKNEEQFTKVMTRPTAATFTSQATHRESIRPRIEVKMGSRIEPMSKDVVMKGNRAKWA